MKKYSLALFLLAILSTLAYSSCKKINESTTLGGDLIPGVDNITTFANELLTRTDHSQLTDTGTILVYGQPVALGHISNDPEFGTTHADTYFSLSLPSYGIYPFKTKDTLMIDSVVLSLAYGGAYGDTNSFQTVNVYEIAQGSGFHDSVGYKFNNPDIAVTGPVLGTRTFQPSELNDSVRYIFRTDTSKVANQLRIKLDTALFGRRFINYDTLFTSNGAYRSDSILQLAFRGLALRATNSGNVLSYFNLANQATQVTFFIRTQKNGVKDTSTFNLYHLLHTNRGFGAQANVIKRTPSGGYATAISSPGTDDDRLFIQSMPVGHYGLIRIPGLDTMTNKVIHRAELIVTRIPSAMDNIFTPPALLFLDKINTARDSAFTFENDMTLDANNLYDPTTFGGELKGNRYVFNITRHVQGILTRKEPNYLLRLYAPLYTSVFDRSTGPTPVRRAISVLAQPANGRVVVAGGNYVDAAQRLRLRIIYSNL